MEIIDFGRSNCKQKGLITFKDRLGASRTSLDYFRYPLVKTSMEFSHRESSGIRILLSLLSENFLSGASRMLYKHLG